MPQEIIDKEKTLKEGITNTERQLHVLSTNESPASIKKSNGLKLQLFDLKLEMQQLLGEMETKYPRYFDLKYKSTTADITIVQQKLLSDSSSLLEYFVGDESIYAFVINNDKSDFIKLGATEDIVPLVEEYSKMVSQFNFHNENMDQYCIDFTEMGVRVFEKLIQPVEGMLNEYTTIIPDGILTYLSFDALMKSLPKQENTWSIRNYDYLVHHYMFNYNYSAELMLEMKSDRDSVVERKLLAIAPSFGVAYNGTRIRSADLGPLKYNEGEAEALMMICDGDMLTKEEASKERFLEEVSKYRAIHFATHGKADDRSGAYSYLAFTQNDKKK